MAPIRVALIGLSSTAKTSWAASAHLPYLLSPHGKAHYQLVAILNSSPSSATAAKQHFDLPPTVKTYSDPDALAADPDIDLVICNTRVDIHYPTIEPSLRAGKAVFVEWPLAENLLRAGELVELGKTKPEGFGGGGAGNIIGLQTRVSPIVLKMKEVLASGRIGSVLSSDVRAFTTLCQRDALPETLSYFAERDVGGNVVTISYGHMIDFVHHVLGEFESFESRMQIQRQDLGVLRKDDGGLKIRSISSDVPDLVAVHGKLAKGKADIVDGATLAVVFRSGPPFNGEPGFVWTIVGEKGELRMTSPLGSMLQIDVYGEPITIELYDYALDEVVNVEWDWEEWQKKLPQPARMVGEVYERYASWVESGKARSDVLGEDEWPILEDALVRMKELETLFGQYDAQR